MKAIEIKVSTLDIMKLRFGQRSYKEIITLQLLMYLRFIKKAGAGAMPGNHALINITEYFWTNYFTVIINSSIVAIYQSCIIACLQRLYHFFYGLHCIIIII